MLSMAEGESEKKGTGLGWILIGSAGVLAIVGLAMASKRKTPRHNICLLGECISIEGEGEDQCLGNSNCPRFELVSHTECRNGRCINVFGIGQDECDIGQPCIDFNMIPDFNFDESIFVPEFNQPF